MNEYTNNNEIRNTESKQDKLVIKSTNMVEIPLRATPYDHEKRQSKLDEIQEYLEDTPDAFNMALEELDDYNGELGDERVYPMWELYDHFGNKSFGEFLDKLGDHFNISDGFFKYTYDGKVETCEEPDYYNHYYSMAEAVEELHENAHHIPTTLDEFPELAQLFEELDEIENGDE